MTESQAREILTRVRAGDKTPTRAKINMALVLSGDITVSLNSGSVNEMREKADKNLLSGFYEAVDKLTLSNVNYKRLESMQRAAMPVLTFTEVQV